jgi:hypothetical protein
MTEMLARAPSNWSGARRLVRLRTAAALLAPTATITGADLFVRAPFVARFDPLHLLGWVGSVGLSGGFWATLLVNASGTRGRARHVARAAFVALFSVVLGGQAAFWGFLRTYASRDVMEDAATPLDALFLDLPGRAHLGVAIAVAGLVAVGLLLAARRFARPSWRTVRRARPALAVLLVALFGAPASYQTLQASSPDHIYFHGLAWYVKRRFVPVDRGERAFRRRPAPLAAITAEPARPRNVLLLLQEAERADSVCVAPSLGCRLANPASSAAAPRRIPLLDMRSNDASTFLSLGVLLTGLSPAVKRSTLESAPLVWDYAHAAGWDTAYMTSQHLIYAKERLFVEDAPISIFLGATHLDPEADQLTGADDAALSDRVLGEWGRLREPFVAVVQYSNVHEPRRIDPARAPYRPFDPTAECTDPRYRNAYLDAVYLSDLAVAKLVQGVRATESGKRTVIVYTADHGESLCEHGQPKQHSFSVYDEEVRVPAWIDAPDGTLAPEEEASLRAAASAPTWHVDLAATLLDLVGVWDAPELAPYREEMPGHPLTRPERTTRPVPLSNMGWLWEARSPNWGLMQGSMKVIMTSFGYVDRAYRCFDVAHDPHEHRDLAGDARCAQLVEEAERVYGRGAPVDLIPMAKHPDWPP